MASIQQEFEVSASVEDAWAVLRDFGGLTRLAPGFVSACALEEEGRVRLVTFANGMQVRERLVTLDEGARRIVYSASGGGVTHHNASAQLFPLSTGRCRFVWIADLLPDALAPAIGQMMAQGSQAMRSALGQAAR